MDERFGRWTSCARPGLPSQEQHRSPELGYALRGVTTLAERGVLHTRKAATVTGAQVPGPFVEGVDKVNLLYGSVLDGPLVFVVLSDHRTPQGHPRILGGEFVPTGFVALCPGPTNREVVVVRAARWRRPTPIEVKALVADLIGRYAHLLRMRLQDNARQQSAELGDAIARALVESRPTRDEQEGAGK